MLQQALQDAIAKQRLSAREVGVILGVSHTTVLRALRGESVDLETLLKIADWLNIRPSALLDTMSEKASSETKIDLFVQMYPALRDVLEKAVVAIENGQADPQIIEDIVAYAAYRIQSAGG